MTTQTTALEGGRFAWRSGRGRRIVAASWRYLSIPTFVLIGGCAGGTSSVIDAPTTVTQLSAPEDPPSFASNESTTTTSAAITTTTLTASSEPPIRPEDVLFDVSRDGIVDWFVQNDTVMGGVSSSSVVVDGPDMVFSGNVSLDNNGGFASLRGPIIDLRSERRGNALSIDATGDGRVYLIQLRTPTDAYIMRYVPGDGPVTLPLSDFTAASWRLDPIPAIAPLTPGSIGQIAIYVLDKQVGEFVLRVRSISLVED